MKKARLLLLDVIDGGGFKRIECEELQDYYDGLKCDCFDIATRRIGDKRKKFDIFVDDCGLFVDKPFVSAIDRHMQPALVGNLIFANHDAEGNTTSLTDEEIEYIESHAVTMINYDDDPPKVWTAITQVDY